MTSRLGESALQHKILQMFQHVLSRLRLATPPCGYRRHLQFFAQQLSAKTWQKRHVGSRLHKSASKRIVDHHRSAANSVHQSGHSQKRIRAKLKWIAVAVVHSSKNQIDGFQSTKSLQVNTAI